MNKLKIQVGGVPEHFNYPWKFALEMGMFQGYPFEISWQDEPAGTGELCYQLEEGMLDIAMVLTEGAVHRICRGSDIRILASYVASPLIWGIHVPANSRINSVSELQDKRYAISRKGSGSHLMACVDARNRGFEIREEQWVITGGIEQTRIAFKKEEADIFFWEKFITRPLVHAGEFRCIGECISPWPCFVMAVNSQFEQKYAEYVELILNTMNAASRMFMNLPDAPQIIARNYGLTQSDAEAWFFSIEWNCGSFISKKSLENAMHHLKDTALIEQVLPAKDLVSVHTLIK